MPIVDRRSPRRVRICDGSRHAELGGEPHVPGGAAARARDRRAGPGDRPRLAVAAGPRVAPRLQLARRHDRRPPLARPSAADRRDRRGRAARSRSTARPATATSRRCCMPPGTRSTTSPRCPTSRSRAPVATGTHGSGDRSGNLSTAVRSMDVVRADGELVTISRAAGSGDLSRRRRLARLPGRRHAPDPRDRAGVRRPPVGLRGPPGGRLPSAPRRGDVGRRQRQRLHALARRGHRAGLGQAPRPAGR